VTPGTGTVLLVGKGPSARTALESLAERFKVVAVVRNLRPQAGEEDEVQRCARELGVPVCTDTSVRGVERAVMEHLPDCTVISSYDRILNAQVLGRSRFVNVHYSLLPRYRGLAAVQWGLINGEPDLGITVHVITERLDAGNILYQNRVAAGSQETAAGIYAKLNEIQRHVLGETVERYLGGYAGVPQDESAATYACARLPEDSEIDWSDSTDRIYAQIRTFHKALSRPYPEAYTYLDTRRISIVSAAPAENSPPYAGGVPGRVVGRSGADGYVDVLSGDGVLRIHEVMTDDRAVHPAAVVIRSTQHTLGLRPAELLERIEALSRRLEQLTGESSSNGFSAAGFDHRRRRA
jgi:methionyl-tRNA formyltransferase